MIGEIVSQQGDSNTARLMQVCAESQPHLAGHTTAGSGDGGIGAYRLRKVSSRRGPVYSALGASTLRLDSRRRAGVRWPSHRRVPGQDGRSHIPERKAGWFQEWIARNKI